MEILILILSKMEYLTELLGNSSGEMSVFFIRKRRMVTKHTPLLGQLYKIHLESLSGNMEYTYFSLFLLLGTAKHSGHFI